MSNSRYFREKRKRLAQHKRLLMYFVGVVILISKIDKLIPFWRYYSLNWLWNLSDGQIAINMEFQILKIQFIRWGWLLKKLKLVGMEEFGRISGIMMKMNMLYLVRALFIVFFVFFHQLETLCKPHLPDIRP